MIYFDEKIRPDIFTKLWTMLKPDGLLFLSITEIGCIDIPENLFTREGSDGIYYLRKRNYLKEAADQQQIQNNFDETSSNKESESSQRESISRKIREKQETAKIGDQRIGCAVSVTTAALKKVCARVTYIGTHWTYSQPKRAQNAYYDCSALVWKAYQPYSKINFGTSYPGSTKSEAPWCRDHGKLMKGGFSYKKMQKMQLNPGDIVINQDSGSHLIMLSDEHGLYFG